MDTTNDHSAKPEQDEPLQDMSVGTSGEMEVIDDAPKNEVVPPVAVMDVTPPPEDPVIKTPNANTAPTSSNSEEDTQNTEKQVVLPTGADPEVPTKASHKGSGKGLIVAIIVVLALVLAAIAVLIFMKADSNTKSANKSTNKTANESQTPAKVTSTDIDTTAKEVDDTVNALNENQDFNTDSLSDKTLGLQ